MFFAASAQTDVECRQLRKLGEILGTYWTRESVQAMFSTDKAQGKKERLEHLMIPHLLGVQPEIQDWLRSQFGSDQGISPPEWLQSNPSELVETYDMPRDEFINVASMFTGLIPKNY